MKNAAIAHHYAADGDLGAAAPYLPDPEWLVRQHQQLVRKLAWQVNGKAARNSQFDDLVQVGFLALIEASKSYEDRGHSFVTYASVRVKGSMIDYLRREMASARSASGKARQISAARDTLYQQLGRSPSHGEMASQLGMTETEYFQFEQLANGAKTVAMEDMDSQFLSMIEQDDADQSSTLERADLLANLQHMIGALTEREQMVLQLYFYEELNLHEIGEVLGVSAARACQIKAGALSRLHTEMRARTDA